MVLTYSTVFVWCVSKLSSQSRWVSHFHLKFSIFHSFPFCVIQMLKPWYIAHMYSSCCIRSFCSSARSSLRFSFFRIQLFIFGTNFVRNRSVLFCFVLFQFISKKFRLPYNSVYSLVWLELCRTMPCGNAFIYFTFGFGFLKQPTKLCSCFYSHSCDSYESNI